MKRNVILIICFSFFTNTLFAAHCGKVTAIVHNPDSGDLAGVTIKRGYKRVRVTSDNSPIFIEALSNEIREVPYREPLDFFVCLDSYKTYKRTYSGVLKTYANVYTYRIYRGGDLLVSLENNSL